MYGTACAVVAALRTVSAFLASRGVVVASALISAWILSGSFFYIYFFLTVYALAFATVASGICGGSLSSGRAGFSVTFGAVVPLWSFSWDV